jgi:hypothetical protein
MPPIEQQGRHQKAVLWAAAGVDSYGQVQVDAAAELTVRWEETLTETQDAKGQPVLSDVTVIVDQEVAIDSIFWLGALDDLPDAPMNLKQVVSRSAVPDLKGRQTFRTLHLAKYSNALPTIAATPGT